MLKLKSATVLVDPKPEDFRVLCAWCMSEMRAPMTRKFVPAPESHGICRPCAVRLGMPESRIVA